MGILRILVNDIPPQGTHMVVDAPEVWDVPMNEFRMECRVVTPLRAELHILPAEGGLLVRGNLSGAVVQACDLCAEDAPTTLAHRIETYESLPLSELPLLDGDDAPEDCLADNDDASHIVLENTVPVLDLAALCWEEFMLALPLRPLCRPDCKGLCATCGANLNETTCACARDEGDPRLAALRNIKIKKSE